MQFFLVLTISLLLNIGAIRAQGTPSCGNATTKVPLHIAYYVSMSGDFISSGTIPAVDLALETINANEIGILPGYNLSYTTIYDTKVRAICSDRMRNPLLTEEILLIVCTCNTGIG